MASKTQKLPVYFKKQAVLLKKRRIRPKQIPIIQATWSIEANGFRGLLNTIIARNGFVTGTVFGNTIRGWYDVPSGKITFLRFVPGGSIPGINNQLYEGYIQRSTINRGITFTGSFITVGNGSSAQLNKFSWVARAIILV
ncbi:hypothetical protein QFZ77_001013 [Paenibacillus sp. V4I3]|uniref:hypothetical protein n=1 Tax=unclassified Paenibacillus TaxID=185978 RepID=UPI00277D964E|nr:MULTISPECIES: hypothetical protein [unclassified Paenibacillus]MDQ0872354.1 hypothetical protein [Paenibacillus sp. V4I3]MDQ0891762.1 hypothetical protein [Paenibacillus sp. V4I9]